MSVAKNATEQHAAMLAMMEKGMRLPPMARIGVAADLAAAQITFNGMVLAELEQMKAKLADN